MRLTALGRFLKYFNNTSVWFQNTTQLANWLDRAYTHNDNGMNRVYNEISVCNECVRIHMHTHVHTVVFTVPTYSSACTYIPQSIHTTVMTVSHYMKPNSALCKYNSHFIGFCSNYKAHKITRSYHKRILIICI